MDKQGNLSQSRRLERTQSVTAKVYQYGSQYHGPPSHEASLELKKNLRYWNELVRIDQDFSERYREIINTADEQIIALTSSIAEKEREITDVREEIKTRRKQARKRIACPDLSTRILTLIQQKRELTAEYREQKKEIKIRCAPNLEALEKERQVKIKQVRHKEYIYWGNYNAVEASFNTARSRTLKTPGSELRVHHFDDTGRLTCQIQKGKDGGNGMSVAEVFSGTSNLFRIDRLPGDAWSNPIRAERRRLTRTTAHLRIASEDVNPKEGDVEDRKRKTGGGAPIWLNLPVTMHRPIPEHMRIKSVSITCKKNGSKFDWFLNITVTEPKEQSLASIENSIHVSVKVNKKPDGSIVIAEYREGSTSPVAIFGLDPSYARTNERLEGLRATRDNHFNQTKESLSIWLKEESNEDLLSGYFYGKIDNLLKTRSQARFAGEVVGYWEKHRFEGDGKIFNMLAAWRKKENHLWSWERNLREKMRLRRREQFRIFARQLADKFDTLVLSLPDLKWMREKPLPEEGGDAARHLRKIMNIAGASYFKEALVHAFGTGNKAVVLDARTGSDRE